MSNGNSSSDPRVQINHKAQAKTNSDKAGPDQELANGINAMTLESQAPNELTEGISAMMLGPQMQNEKTLGVQPSTNMSSGQPNTSLSAQATDNTPARQNQTTDQSLASHIGSFSIIKFADMSKIELRYIVRLMQDKPISEVQEELWYRGIFLDDLSLEDLIGITAQNLDW
ncbi:hypothetical protein FSPOR_1771 [Fusarium sporotrichioides]|uniref:Uncharacterized protein n=1 Tax=Fusarium sporotrichioides TaxID=5514 RepID=A0A395SNY4_FUSSP|nr:hypothetical protein FSPOR_1771 [Fusarium sporotrichioides]